MADAGEISEPERVPRCLADARRTVERDAGLGVTPRVARRLEAAARGLFPLGLRRQPRPRPPRKGDGLGPRETDDGLPRVGERGVGPERGRRGAGRGQIGGEVRIRRGRERDQKGVDPHDVRWALARMAVRPAHGERPRPDACEVHAL